jgi:hypothetical protein
MAAPTVESAPSRCNLIPQLTVGSIAQVHPSLPNAIRSAPGHGTDSQVIGEIAVGTIVNVLDGPV